MGKWISIPMQRAVFICLAAAGGLQSQPGKINDRPTAALNVHLCRTSMAPNPDRDYVQSHASVLHKCTLRDVSEDPCSR